MELQRVSAIVTGGASGLGEATSRALIGGGARVAILDANVEAGKRLADELGAAALFCPTDVTDDDAVADAVAAAAGLGTLRVAVNCAGTGAGIRTIDRNGKPHSRNVWQKVADINLLGTFPVMTRAASAMASTSPVDSSGQRGVIVN